MPPEKVMYPVQSHSVRPGRSCEQNRVLKSASPKFLLQDTLHPQAEDKVLI